MSGFELMTPEERAARQARIDSIRIEHRELLDLLARPCSCVTTPLTEPGITGTRTEVCENCIRLRQFLKAVLFTADEATHLQYNREGIPRCMDARCSRGAGPCQSIALKLKRLRMGAE